MRKYFLVIDQGTTSSRIVLYNKKFEIFDIVQKEFKQYFPNEGWVEHNATEIWEDVRNLISKILKKNKLNSKNIISIGITNQRETTVLWNKKTGKPIYRAIVWQDRRTANLCEKLKRKGTDKKIQKITGLELDPYFSATKIKWIIDNVKEVNKNLKNNNKIIWRYAKTNDSSGKTKYKKTYSKNFPTELSFYYFYKEKFPNHPNIKLLENLVFDKRMCKVPAKQRMKYCASDEDEIRFIDIVKNDSEKLKKQNSFMGERCFYFTGKYKPEIRNNFVVVVKNKVNAEYLFKTKGPSKKITEKKGMKDCESKYNEGCYIHYSSRLAFGS